MGAFLCLCVTSRKIARTFYKQMRVAFVPPLHSIQGRFADYSPMAKFMAIGITLHQGALVMVLIALAFPLTGAVLLSALVLDACLIARLPALKRRLT